VKEVDLRVILVTIGWPFIEAGDRSATRLPHVFGETHDALNMNVVADGALHTYSTVDVDRLMPLGLGGMAVNEVVPRLEKIKVEPSVIPCGEPVVISGYVVKLATLGIATEIVVQSALEKL